MILSKKIVAHKDSIGVKRHELHTTGLVSIFSTTWSSSTIRYCPGDPHELLGWLERTLECIVQ